MRVSKPKDKKELEIENYKLNNKIKKLEKYIIDGKVPKNVKCRLCGRFFKCLNSNRRKCDKCLNAKKQES